MKKLLARLADPHGDALLKEREMSALRKKLLMSVAAIAICAVGHLPSASAQISGVGGDASTRFFLRGTDSRICLYKINVSLGPPVSHCYGPYPGWLPIALTTRADRNTVVLWRNTDERISLWLVDPNLNWFYSKIYPNPGWIAEGLSADTDGGSWTRLIWRDTEGRISVYVMDPNLNFGPFGTYGPYPGLEPDSAQASAKSSVSAAADRKAAAAMETDVASAPVPK
jgi:hypothetical protein